MTRNAISLLALILMAGAAESARAQGLTYERQQLQQGNEKVAGIVPLPFNPPQPRNVALGTIPGEDRNAPAFRTLTILDAALGNWKDTNLGDAYIIGASQPSGFAPPLTAPKFPAHPIYAVLVTSRLPIGIPGVYPIAPVRPDGSQKGHAVILSGFHAREWMSIEAVVRKLEVFQRPEFLDDLKGIDPTTKKPRLLSRDAFFAENLFMTFAPMLNPSGLEVSQADDADGANWKTCQMLTIPATPLPGIPLGRALDAGNLADGRFRRKNLLGSDGILGADQTKDPDAFEGVDVNRNLTTDSPDSLDHRSAVYRGWTAGASVAVPETAAVYSLLDARFSQTGSPVSFFPRPAPALALTGAGILDLHTPLATTTFSTHGPAAPPGRPDRFGGLGNAVFTKRDGEALADPNSLGTSEYLGRVVYGVPTATVELDPDPGLPAFSPKNVLGSTLNDLLLMDNLADEVFNARLAVATRSMNGLLTWAAGPPYVRQVVIVNGDVAPPYDPSKTGADTEVLYWTSWEPVPGNADARQRVDHLQRWPGQRYLSGSRSPDGAKVVPMMIAISFSKPMRGIDSTTTGGTLIEDTSMPPTRVELVTANDFKLADFRALADASLRGLPVWVKKDVFIADETAAPPAIQQLGGLRYENDTWLATVDVPVGDAPLGWTVLLGRLLITAEDRSIPNMARTWLEHKGSLRLDADPRTVAKIANGVFSGYEDGSGYRDADAGPTTDKGGADRNHGPFQIDTVRPRLIKLP